MESDCSDESCLSFSRSSTSSLVSIIEDDLSCNSDHSFASEEENGDYLSGSIETSNEDLMSVDDELSEVIDEKKLNLNTNYNHSKGDDQLFNDNRNSKDILLGDNLTPWEKWVLNKAKLRMKLKVKRQREIASIMEKEEQTRQLKEERRKKFEEMFAMKMKERKKDFMKSSLIKSESEKSFPKVPADKIDENFKQWFCEKLKKSKELRRQENLSRSQKMLKEQERQKKAKESYEKWLEKNKGKILGQRRSYGFINGKLTGYYDAGANPEPTYINPCPWSN